MILSRSKTLEPRIGANSVDGKECKRCFQYLWMIKCSVHLCQRDHQPNLSVGSSKGWKGWNWSLQMMFHNFKIVGSTLRKKSVKWSEQVYQLSGHLVKKCEILWDHDFSKLFFLVIDCMNLILSHAWEAVAPALRLLFSGTSSCWIIFNHYLQGSIPISIA